jgi:hypothetical protein
LNGGGGGGGNAAVVLDVAGVVGGGCGVGAMGSLVTTTKGAAEVDGTAPRGLLGVLMGIGKVDVELVVGAGLLATAEGEATTLAAGTSGGGAKVVETSTGADSTGRAAEGRFG